MDKLYKLIVYVPTTHADVVRDVLSKNGAGNIGNYDSCSFSVKGTGRFRGQPGTEPHIGQPGQLESVEEERIETVVPASKVKHVYNAVVAAHPYEEVAIDLFELIDVDSKVASGGTPSHLSAGPIEPLGQPNA